VVLFTVLHPRLSPSPDAVPSGGNGVRPEARATAETPSR
jgi:hypothetical protein